MNVLAFHPYLSLKFVTDHLKCVFNVSWRHQTFVCCKSRKDINLFIMSLTILVFSTSNNVLFKIAGSLGSKYLKYPKDSELIALRK